MRMLKWITKINRTKNVQEERLQPEKRERIYSYLDVLAILREQKLQYYQEDRRKKRAIVKGVG